MKSIFIKKSEKRQPMGATKSSLLSAVCFIVFTCTCFAQDIIVTKDSKKIDAKVMEVNVDNIRYKRWDNLDGPTYTLPKGDIVTIVYQNGLVETFGLRPESEPEPASSSEPAPSLASPPTLMPTTAAAVQVSTARPVAAPEKQSNGVFEIISFSNDTVKLKTLAETKFYSAALISGSQTFEAKLFSNIEGTVRWANGSQFWAGSSMQLPAAFGVGAMTLPKDAVLNVYGFAVPANFEPVKIKLVTEGKNEMYYHIPTLSWDQ